MIFIGYQTIIPLFFSFYPQKLRKSPPPCPRSSLPPSLLASSLACLLPAPVPPCSQPCLPPPCPRSRKFSSGLQLRAPSLVLPPSSSVLTVHNPQPPFCLHFSCPYVSLSICAFWLSHFYSFTPSSLLSCPPIQYAYSCVLLFFPLLSLTAIDVYAFDIPKTGNLTVTKEGGNCTFVDNVRSLRFFRSFRSPLPPQQHRGERWVESVSLLYREDSCGAYKQEHSCYNHHHRLV